VTQQQVAAIIRQPVARTVVAKLGPTCVYVPGGARAHLRKHGHSIEVTIAVSPMSFKDAVASLGAPTTFTVTGHRSSCGVIGHPITYVSLAYGHVMTVAAPCPLAASIAKIALTHL
jgi:hypothetical protein